MNPRLQLLQRRMERQNPEQPQAPEGHGLGAAIEKLIADEVERRVGEAVERSPKVDRLMQGLNKPKPVSDYRQLDPVPKPVAPAKNRDIKFFRDGAGQVQWAQIGDVKLQVQRDGAGVVIGMQEVTESPILPAPPIPYMDAARAYHDGESR
ncbi:hypothetical protein SAMN04489798_2308 [Pseudomonas arsenicoxydans]|uniref:Uncharacterized protein n=1 Tax=Pseudomonas arsenicoxydans TaxID=702115 RepID=A0A1H0HLU2_9PSED|nr:hypothetical protein [Pseudomonas arsenicoxydans]SDO20179.1 hypothetical protein SAMN04489798_2308 [Pseudomonas arsenicoxydans]